ncbi:site-specific integrase [Maridesulfovibrio ferrireducens]|uniref:tyrosine-type recombinase/integrase n=1 Tax=Maridesulfovibrio ferrireducens TaxID=246191 RepID=UPI001A212183|nr:site-specific integrase [Maridesulfovibrio ferrireducens]MBI9110249.1 site-specific integrase [Maridesulfovibrio ferrireducens]
MRAKKEPTIYPGVRYRSHATRMHAGKPDRYFFIRYKLNGKGVEEGLGWASEGMNAKRASLERSKLRESQRTGSGPQSLHEAREDVRTEQESARLDVLEHKQENMLFDELVPQYLKWAEANKKTWIWDERRLRNHIQPVLGVLKLKEISATELEELKFQCQKKGLAPATINHCINLASSLFNFANRLGIYEGKNPVRDIKKIKHDNKRVRFLSHDEARKLMKEVKSRSEDFYHISMVSLYAGLRFGEITGLTWSDIDLEHRIIHVLDPKSGYNRQAHLVDLLYDLFSIRFREQESNPSPNSLIFPGRQGQQIFKVSHTYKRSVDDLKMNEGITDHRHKVVFHTLRHTFASWLALQGTSLYMIKELLGHKTLEMTMRYAHLLPDQKKSAVEEMASKAAL